MRRRSIAGPLLLIIIGGLFLWRNVHPEIPVFDIVAQYWPFALIAWGVLRTFEILLSRQGRYSGLSGGEVALIIFICVIGLGLFEVHRMGPLPFVRADIFGEQFEYPVSAQIPAAGVKTLVIDNQRGTVHVTGGDGQEILVTGHKLIRAYTRSDAERTNGDTPVDLLPAGDRVRLDSHQDRAPAGQRIADDLEITVPRGIAVEARSNSGDYEISDVDGDVQVTGVRADVRLARLASNVRLELQRSGMISASDVKGNFSIEGGRGSDLDLENIAGEVTVHGDYVGSVEFKNLAKPLHFEGARNTELRVEGVPGSISMDLGDFTGTNLMGPVRLVAQSRDVRLSQFTSALELDVQRGDVQLDPAHVPLPKIEAHSGIGEIELVLPDNAPFVLEATTERGEATNAFGPPIQWTSAGRGAVLRGAVASGGPTIRLTAHRGSISVRKAAAAQTPENAAPVNLKQTETKL